MTPSFSFDPNTHLVSGPAGTLPIAPSDDQATRLLMLVEGECMEGNVVAVAQRHGLSRQRYYQLLDRFKAGGVPALLPQKSGPKSNYRRTEQVVRQILRYRFLDPEASPEVITQKLQQKSFHISLRTVHRVIADFGVQKKTSHAQPQKHASTAPHPTGRKTRPPRTRRP